MTEAPIVYRGRFNDGGLVALTGALIIYGLLYSHLMSFLTATAGISSTPVYLVVIGLGGILASGVFVRRSLTRSSVMVIALVVTYVAILLVSSMFLDSSTNNLVIDRIFWALMTISATILLSNIRRPDIFLTIIRSVVLISAIVIFWEFFSGFSLPWKMSVVPGRAAGLFQNPNDAAMFMAIFLPVATIRLKRSIRVIWYALTLACIFLTFSRGGLALCASAILLIEAFPAQTGGATTLRRIFVLVIVAIAAAALYRIVTEFIVDDFSRSFNANAVSRSRLESNDSSNLRFYVLQLAWKEFASSPFWGFGAGAGDRWGVGVSTHNLFAVLALEYGIIGLAWLAGLLMALWSIRKPFGIWAAALFSIAGLFSHNLIDGPIYALILATYAALPAIFTPLPGRRLAARPQAVPTGRSRHPHT